MIRSGVTDFVNTAYNSSVNLLRQGRRFKSMLTSDTWPVGLQRDEDVGGADFVLLREFLDSGVCEEWRVI